MKMTSMKMTMMTIKHYYQVDGISCGPTCLKMINDYFEDERPHEEGYSYPTIKEISVMCGTDSIVGTPPDRMEKGMSALSLKHIEYQGSPRPFELLREILENNNIPILRTITNGIPHWILIKGFMGYEFYVNDPWLGEIIYSEKELNEIWKIRNYQFFEIINKDDEYSRRHS